MQKALDARIIKEKGLEGQDLLPNTVLALQVEIAELANEWRGFKHWSDKKEPKHGYSAKIDCDRCSGKGFWFDGGRVHCGKCGTTGKITNPLLEEYADGVSFFLSIARQNDWSEYIYIVEDAIEETRETGLDGGIGGAILEVKYWMLKMYMERGRDEKIESTFGYSKQVFCFRNAWYVFIAIGLVGFDFTWEQIAAAYMEKNKVNHERQANGY
ncbi:dUTP diphosphatase [Paenibacillus albiflavus]